MTFIIAFFHISRQSVRTSYESLSLLCTNVCLYEGDLRIISRPPSFTVAWFNMSASSESESIMRGTLSTCHLANVFFPLGPIVTVNMPDGLSARGLGEPSGVFALLLNGAGGDIIRCAGLREGEPGIPLTAEEAAALRLAPASLEWTALGLASSRFLYSAWGLP